MKISREEVAQKLRVIRFSRKRRPSGVLSLSKDRLGA